MEIEVGGNTYRTEKLDARKQFHLSRRLMPLLVSLAKGFASSKEAAALLTDTEAVKRAVVGTAEQKKDTLALVDAIMSALGPSADVLAQMPEADMDYVINMCMRVCQRKMDGGLWSPVMAQGGNKFMFDDMDMTVLIRIAVSVIVENLASFFLDMVSKSQP